MPFVPGQSGNPSGRPKGAKDHSPKTILEAFDQVIRENPELVMDAIRAGLESKRAFNFVELGAKMKKEIGSQEQQAAQIAIVFTGTLDPKMLQVDAKVIECPAESKVPELTNASSLITNQDKLANASLKTIPFVLDSSALLEPVSQPQE